MTKKQAEKMQNQIATLIRANKALKEDVETMRLELKSLDPVEGASTPNRKAMAKARQCFDAGDTNGAIAHMLGR